jgi:hypothetical protein
VLIVALTWVLPLVCAYYFNGRLSCCDDVFFNRNKQAVGHSCSSLYLLVSCRLLCGSLHLGDAERSTRLQHAALKAARLELVGIR